MAELSVSSSEIFRWLRCAWRCTARAMRPRPLFLAPQQDNPVLKADAALSRWCIAVRVQSDLFHRKKEIPDCSIELRVKDYYERDESPIFHMRWKSKDSPAGYANMTLRTGRTYRIPIVERHESNEAGRTKLLNERYLTQGKGFEFDPGRYFIELAIRSGPHTWKSGGKYFLGVPKRGESNGLFCMDIKYEDQHPTREWSES